MPLKLWQFFPVASKMVQNIDIFYRIKVINSSKLPLQIEWETLSDLNIFFILWKSMATINCLVTIILQNTFFCAQQLKETPTGLKQLEGEKMITIFFFGWTIPLKPPS